jgi:hypothetical protein
MQRVITRYIKYKAISRNALKLDYQIISTCSLKFKL